MILVDTSVWIDFFRGRAAAARLSDLIEQREIATIGCIFAELLQGARSQEEVETLSSYWADLPRLNEDSIWFEAGLLSFQNKYYTRGVGLIDLAIITAARKNQCRIWTLDKKLQSVLELSEVF